jgi:hypothetical protein
MSNVVGYHEDDEKLRKRSSCQLQAADDCTRCGENAGAGAGLVKLLLVRAALLSATVETRSHEGHMVRVDAAGSSGLL